MKSLARIIFLTLTLLLAVPHLVPAQKQKQTAEEKARIAEQRRIVEQLEKELEEDEKKLNSIKKDKSTAQQRVRSITKQINSRNQLLNRTEREITTIEKSIAENDELLRQTQEQYTSEREAYAEMVREAYRNYKQNNYITYILASESFTDAARRIANIRAIAVLREERIHRMDSLAKSVEEQQSSLAERRRTLDDVQRKAEAQRKKLQSDVSSAQKAMNQLTKREQAALKQKMASEERLDAAIDALRKLTKGNKEGASFSRNTTNLNLPVVGGRVKEYKGNMAEIVGEKGADVRSIYEGKVVEVRRNRITGKYDVFVAHGEYITSYANLDNVVVRKDQKIAKNGTLGEVGASVNLATMKTEYKMVFGIYSPNPKETMRAANCFKKK
ncbi:MAG: peptidoglycan DD-metalloendopeptidase family protein [Alistipes sp.]|nr:peptidoglycan DD-metalloendopeptidase family protein [Alistipes sp.]